MAPQCLRPGAAATFGVGREVPPAAVPAPQGRAGTNELTLRRGAQSAGVFQHGPSGLPQVHEEPEGRIQRAGEEQSPHMAPPG